MKTSTGDFIKACYCWIMVSILGVLAVLAPTNSQPFLLLPFGVFAVLGMWWLSAAVWDRICELGGNRN